MAAVNRVHNFSAGPACLPPSVLQEAQAEMMSYQGSGMSFMEMSHRDANGPVQETISKCVDLVKDLLSVPDNYHILFMHGGAHGQFAAVPMNIAYEAGKVDFVDCGAWSQKAMKETSKYVDCHVCATYTDRVVPPSEWKYRKEAAYIHVCLNETMTGIEMLTDPVLPADAPVVVADATSTLFSRPMDITKYGIVYASAGKNFGPAGMCVVIIRSDLLARTPHPLLPALLDYRESAFSKPISSIYNTPPCFQLYMSAKVWTLQLSQGGLVAMERQAILRSNKIYKIFDESGGFYTNTVHPGSRSRMNMCFRIRNSSTGDAVAVALEKLFVSQSEAAGLFQLFGHPVYGGLRVTIYNGQEDDAVDAVAVYLTSFWEKYKHCTDLAAVEQVIV